MKSPLQLVLLSLGLFLITGCANGFREYYRPAMLFGQGALAPYSGKTQVFASNNIESDGYTLGARGYVCIGTSGFTSTGRTTESQAKSQGESVGADIVLWSAQYLGSEQTTVPIVQYQPGQTSTTTYSGNANANAYGSGGYGYANGNYNGQSTTTSPGTYTTQYVPVTVQRCAYQASYWRKSVP